VGASITVNPTTSTMHYAFASTSGTCLNAALPVNVEVAPAAFATQDTITDVICHDEVLTLTVSTSGGSTVEWYTTPDRAPGSLVYVGNPYVLNPQPQTNDAVEIIEYYGFATDGSSACYSENFTYVHITYLGELDAPLGETEYFICEGQSVEMYAEGIQISQTCWFDTDPPVGSPLMIDEYYTVTPASTTTYYAYTEFSIGCLSPALPVSVIVETCPDALIGDDATVNTLEIDVTPSVVMFSPNNDGIEDEVFIGTPEMTKDYYVEIYNMTGQLVKTLNNYNDGWDGRDINGKIQPNGYYVYVLEANGVKEKRLVGISK